MINAKGQSGKEGGGVGDSSLRKTNFYDGDNLNLSYSIRTIDHYCCNLVMCTR